MNEAVQQLIADQLAHWELAATNYQALAQVKTKLLTVDGHRYRVQFNPARILSSAAQVDAQSLQKRKCFLCAANRPAQQEALSFKDKYEILINPYPVFPRHLTLPALAHTPQAIAGRLGDMLDLAQALDDYILFYNGPKCGASAPDHFHFQAGSKGFLPIEQDTAWPNTVRVEERDKAEALRRFQLLYDSLPVSAGETEPMMNILTWYDGDKWILCVIPRKKHRPACYFAEGDKQILISPASVDLGGVMITPLESSFHLITADTLKTIINEV
jgi:ATP adenylyltransferase/5',5'''-P-1,P-4-tetraphosphate phosphorylase II